LISVLSTVPLGHRVRNVCCDVLVRGRGVVSVTLILLEKLQAPLGRNLAFEVLIENCEADSLRRRVKSKLVGSGNQNLRASSVQSA